MQLTPHRAELVLEALQLREFGYTQQQIADTLSTPAEEVPQQTISYWLKHFGNGTIGDVGKYTRLTNRDEGSSTNIKPLPITLFPCKYEELERDKALREQARKRNGGGTMRTQVWNGLILLFSYVALVGLSVWSIIGLSGREPW